MQGAGEVSRYLVGGTANTVGGYLVFATMIAGGVPVTAAIAVTYAVGMASGFAIHRRWVFRRRGSAMAFLACNVTAAVGNRLLLQVTAGWGWPDLLGQVAALAVVVPLLFLALRQWVFTTTRANVS